MNDLIKLQRTLSLLSNGDAIRLVNENVSDFNKSELMIVAEDLASRLYAAEYMINETNDGRAS